MIWVTNAPECIYIFSIYFCSWNQLNITLFVLAFAGHAVAGGWIGAGGGGGGGDEFLAAPEMAFGPQPEADDDLMFRGDGTGGTGADDSSHGPLAAVTEVREFFAETWVFSTVSSGYLRLILFAVIFSFCFDQSETPNVALFFVIIFT